MRCAVILACSVAALFLSARSEAQCVEGDCMGGKGTYVYDSGSRYSGDFFEGKKHGSGVFTWIDGREYRGRFDQDKADGSGLLLLPDGRIKDVMFGSGTLISSRFISQCGTAGECRYGRFDFRGEYTGWFKGNAKEGFRPHGRGRMAYPNGSVYTGQWEEGKMHGNGTILWDDGSSYVGEWHHGKRRGFGIYRWVNGKVYTGGWDDNNMSGYGIMLNPDGVELKGLWKEGVIYHREE